MSQFLGNVHNLVLAKMDKGELNFESKEALRNVLKEYEIHTKVIEEQLDICKKDHVALRQEMNSLIEENRELNERLRKMADNTDKSAIESSDAVEKLQQQLALATEEKDTMEAMWKTSLQELEGLKEKLQELQSGKQLLQAQNKLQDVQKDYTEAIRILENKQAMLKTENDQLNIKNQFLEDQLKQVLSQLNSVTENNLTVNNSLQQCSEREQELKTRYLNLEAKYIELDRLYQADKVKYNQIHEYEKAEKGLQERLESVMRQRDELQTALERCQDRMADHLRTAGQDRARIEEAVALVEGATRDRDEALAREKVATEELKKLTAEVERMVDEAAKKVVKEEACLRSSFECQMLQCENKLQLVEKERNRYRADVEQLQKECERLQGLLKEAQQQDKWEMDQASRELRTAGSACQKLLFENEKLKEVIKGLEERCEKNNFQRQRLKSELGRLVKNTQFYQQELALSEQKVDLLSSQLQLTSLDLATLQSKTLVDRGPSGLEHKISSANLEVYKKMDESYDKMSNKWKSEMNAMADQFEAKLKKTKKKCSEKPRATSTEKPRAGSSVRFPRESHNKK